MIAVDTSIAIDYFQGVQSKHTELLEKYLSLKEVWLPPAVETELLSDPGASAVRAMFIKATMELEIHEGYWRRAGENRAKLKAKKLKARTIDALIAQSCLDHNIPLLTRDDDFRHFAKHCGLRLLK